MASQFSITGALSIRAACLHVALHVCMAWQLDSLTAWQSLLLYVELQTFSKVSGCRCTDEIWTSWWHLRQRQELMQETALCYIFVSRTENCSAKLTCFMLDQRIDISNSHFWDCPVFKRVFKVNNWRLVWEATKVEKQQAQAVQELTGKLRHGGMANLRMLRIRFEQESNEESNDQSDSGVIRVTVASGAGRWTKTPTNSSTAQRPESTFLRQIWASLASVFWGWLCIMIFILAHFRDEGGPPKRPADVLFVRTRIRSAVAGRSLCEKDWRHWRSSSTCFNTLDKSCALVNHLSFAISFYSSWTPAPRWR